MPFLLLLLTVFIFETSCTSSKVYKIDGSSTVYPISEAMAEEFTKYKNNNTKITVGVSGTGGGFKKFCRGEIDIASASRPIKDKEIKDCAVHGIYFIELPIAYDATVIAVHKTNPISQMSVSQLKKIWEPSSQGLVVNWNQIETNWPHKKMKLFGAGVDSGTFEYFTEVIVGKSRSSRGDYTASEDDNIIIKGITQDETALGYVPYAYYVENEKNIKALSIINKQSVAVFPSPETVIDGSYNPLARPLFLYVNKKSIEDSQFKDFLNFYISQASVIVKEVKYIPLSDEDYAKSKKLLNNFP